MAVISDFVSFRVRLTLDFAFLFFFFSLFPHLSDTAWWLSRFCALYTYSGYLIATGEAYITNNLLVQTIFYVDTDTGVHTVDMVTWDFLSFLSLRKKKKEVGGLWMLSRRL